MTAERMTAEERTFSGPHYSSTFGATYSGEFISSFVVEATGARLSNPMCKDELRAYCRGVCSGVFIKAIRFCGPVPIFRLRDLLAAMPLIRQFARKCAETKRSEMEEVECLQQLQVITKEMRHVIRKRKKGAPSLSRKMVCQH